LQGELGVPGGYRNDCIFWRGASWCRIRVAAVIDVTAPLPPHMQQSWNLIGSTAARYDPIVEAPEE
jgi:hypothetical protein